MTTRCSAGHAPKPIIPSVPMFCISSKRAAAVAALAAMAFATSCARRYRAQGLVLAVDRAAGHATISHRAIPGYMEAMAMPFPVERPQELDGLAPGSRVEFQLKV